MQILPKEEGQRDPSNKWTSQLTVSTSTHPLCRREGGTDDLSFREIATLDQVLSLDSSHYNSPLRSCRECTETLMVVQETELSRSKLYVIYLHRTASDTTVPIASEATLSAGAPAAATPDWEMWDHMFLQPFTLSVPCLTSRTMNRSRFIWLFTLS